MASKSNPVKKRSLNLLEMPLTPEKIPYIRTFPGNTIESTLDPETVAELRDDDQESVKTLLRIIFKDQATICTLFVACAVGISVFTA